VAPTPPEAVGATRAGLRQPFRLGRMAAVPAPSQSAAAGLAPPETAAVPTAKALNWRQKKKLKLNEAPAGQKVEGSSTDSRGLGEGRGGGRGRGRGRGRGGAPSRRAKRPGSSGLIDGGAAGSKIDTEIVERPASFEATPPKSVREDKQVPQQTPEKSAEPPTRPSTSKRRFTIMRPSATRGEVKSRGEKRHADVESTLAADTSIEPPLHKKPPTQPKRESPRATEATSANCESNAQPTKKELGRQKQLADLMTTVRGHIRKRDFDRAEQVAGVLTAFCEKEKISRPETLSPTKKDEDTTGPTVDMALTDEAPKGDPLDVARDALRRCFPLRCTVAGKCAAEEDADITPQVKARKVGRNVAAASASTTQGAADDECLDDTVAKFAQICEAEPGEYLLLHAVGAAFRDSVVAGGYTAAAGEDALRAFYELFQLDDKGFGGMASAEYLALVRAGGDKRHSDTAAAFAAFWAEHKRRGRPLPEAPARLPTSEERRLAAESGVPPSWRVQVFHRSKREDLVVLTGPDGTPEYTTKQGLRDMAGTEEAFMQERRLAEEAGVRMEEARLHAAMSLDRRRRFAEERQSFLVQRAKECMAACERFEQAFDRICGGKAEGVALHGLPADCLGTYVRLEEQFNGCAAYERLVTAAAGAQRTFLFRSCGRWIVADKLDAAAQPYAYVDDVKAELPQDIDRDSAVWKVPADASAGGDFQEMQEGVAWCAALSPAELTNRAFTALHRDRECCPVCRKHPAGEGHCDELADDLEGRAERLAWVSYEDVPDATEEERACYSTILRAFDAEGYPYLTGVKKLMALYGKSPQAMGTKEFHRLVREDPVNAICNGFDSSAVLYFIMFWEKFGATSWVPTEAKSDMELRRMDDRQRKAYLREWQKYEVDPSAAYEVQAQKAAVQDLQIDMPLSRLIADVTLNWKEDLKGFLSPSGFLQENADACGLVATRCGADMLPEPTEDAWASWGGVLRGFDEWRPTAVGTSVSRVRSGKPHVEVVQRLLHVHGKAPEVVASDRYGTVVGWEFGKDSPEAFAVMAFSEFWRDRGGMRMPSPTAGLLFGAAVPARWRVPAHAKVVELRRMRRALQLPATWELILDPAFSAKEPVEEGGRTFVDESTLRAELQRQLEERQQEQRRKDAVARDWHLPPRFEVEFMADGTPRVIGPDGTIYESPEEVPRPQWLRDSKASRTGNRNVGRTSSTGNGDNKMQTIEQQMMVAAYAYDFERARRLRQDLIALRVCPKESATLKKRAREPAAQAGTSVIEPKRGVSADGDNDALDDVATAEEASRATCGDKMDVDVADSTSPGSAPKVVPTRYRAGRMPIVKKVEGEDAQRQGVKYTKQAGLKQLQEKQIETGELELLARSWRLMGVRATNGDICPLEACTEKDPASVVCVLGQVADEITLEEEKRVRQEWGLDDTWTVHVRIRLSGNQVTVRSPEGYSYCKKGQVAAAARSAARRQEQIHRAAALEELLQLLKGATAQCAFEVSGVEGAASSLNGIYLLRTGAEAGRASAVSTEGYYTKCCKAFGVGGSNGQVVTSGALMPIVVRRAVDRPRWNFARENGQLIAFADSKESPCAAKRLRAPAGSVALEGGCTVRRLDTRQVIARVVERIGASAAKTCRTCTAVGQSSGSTSERKTHSTGADTQQAYEAKLRYLDSRRKDAPRDLGAMAAHMVHKVFDQLPDRAQALQRFFAGSTNGRGTLRLGTFCSGTDSPAIALKHLSVALGTALGSDASKLGFEHIFSCEFDQAKQGFLLKNFDMDYLFSDVTQMGRHRAWDVKSQSVQDVPGDIDVVVAGFSCKDLSFMNSYRKTLEEMGQSGSTLRGCLDYIERKRPRLVLLENVFAIDRADQHGLKQVNIVMEGLRARGYAAGYKLCNSCDYYVPQVRHRIWMWGIRVDSASLADDHAAEVALAKASRASLAINPQVEHLLGMLEEPSALHFDDMMLSEDDPRVHEFNRQVYSKVSRSREGGRSNKQSDQHKLTWQQKYTMHRMKLDYAAERPYTSERGARWVGMLNERHRELVDLKCLDVMNEQSMDPRRVPMLWDLLQSVERVPGSRVRRDRLNYAMCVLPPSNVWHTVRHRFVLGVEKLALQGIFASDLLDVSSFSQELLSDLAGNAFTSTVCLANLICAAAFHEDAQHAAS